MRFGIRPKRALPRVTVVVPVYDVERWLPASLDSVLGQSGVDLQVVVVDDGSADASRAILRRWRDSGRFERFVYEERPRSGVAVTREPGHVRIMVRPWIGWGPWDRKVVEEANQVIMRTVRQNAWKIANCWEHIEGFVIKVEEEK